MVVDAIHTVPRIIGVDEKIALRAGDDGAVVSRFVGGVTLNHLGWARLLGLRVAVFGKQADDAEGRFLRAGMRRLGIEARLDLSGSGSSFSQVFVDAAGGRSIYMSRGATAELTADEIDAQHRGVIEAASVVTTEISQVPLAVVRRVLERARESGARTILDVDLPLADAVPLLGSEADLRAALALADVIKPSLSAAAGLVEASGAEEIARELAKRTGASAVVLTAGAEGAVLAVEGEVLRVPAPSVRVLDTTGAGDAFLGGLVAGLHLELGWEDAARLGNACGACCCESLGAFPERPEEQRRRVLELYAGGGGRALDLTGLDLPGGESPGKGADGLEAFLEIAAAELAAAARDLDRAELAAVADLILAAEAQGGRVHVTGVGKPEHVAHYGASLLASTGTPATFLHATEAAHGSVGQLRSGDVVLAISNSGETAELLAAAAAVRGMDARLVAVTSAPSSSLARAAERLLCVKVEREGGALGLAPRTSILAQTLALAALSVALQERKGLTREQYARRHPAGELGRKSRG